MTAAHSLTPLSEVLTPDMEYIEVPEGREYRKLSVKLYGKGVSLDPPTNGAALKMRRHQIAKSGQVILSEIWGKKGAVGFVPPEGEGALCTSHFFLFDINESRVERRWLDWIFRANYLEDQLDASAKGTTGYAAVRPKHLLACSVPLPTLAEQRRIVARIEELAARISEAIRLRGQAAEESEATLTATLRTTFAECPGAIVPLENVCTAIIDNLHSNPRYSDSGVACVRSPDVGHGTLNVENALRTDEDEYRRRTVRAEPRANDVVFVREGGGTGKCALVLEGQRFSLGQRVMMLRPDPAKVLPRFLLQQLLSPQMQEDQIVPLCKGSASPHLNIAALRTFAFRLPALTEQTAVVTELDRFQAKYEDLRRLQRKTSAEFDALMPAILNRAFKGEL